MLKKGVTVVKLPVAVMVHRSLSVCRLARPTHWPSAVTMVGAGLGRETPRQFHPVPVLHSQSVQVAVHAAGDGVGGVAGSGLIDQPNWRP